MAGFGTFWNPWNSYRSTGLHRAIVGDPQGDGGPNPELVEASGPIRVTPLRNLSGHAASVAWRRLPHYADGDDGASGEEDENENADDTTDSTADGSYDDEPDFNYDEWNGNDGTSGSVPPPAPPNLVNGPLPSTSSPPTDSGSSMVNGQPANNSQPPTPDSTNGTPSGGQAPMAGTSWSTANAQRSVARPMMRSSVAPVFPGPSVNDVLGMGQSAHYTPEQTANLVKAWHRQAVDYAQKNGSAQGYFAGAAQADWDAQNALDTLRQFSSQPNAQQNPVFSIPRQSASGMPILGSDGQPLATFTPRLRPDGSLDLLMNVPDLDYNGDHGNQYGVLNVPAVTQADIEAARKQAQARATQLSQQADELAKRANTPVLGDDGVYSGSNSQPADALRQDALQAAARAKMLSDDPQQAWATLTTERAADALRSSSLADKVGRSGFGPVLENFARSVNGFIYKSGMLIDDALGRKETLAQDQQQYENTMSGLPGDTGSQFRGGWSATPGKVSGFLGSMAPVIAMSLIPGGSAAAASLQAAGDADARAREQADGLDAQAQYMRSLGQSGMATELQNQANQVRANRFAYAASSAAVNALAGSVIPKLPPGSGALKNLVRSAGENTLISAAQGQGLDPHYLGESQRMGLGDTVSQGALGGVLGHFHEKLAGLHVLPESRTGVMPPLASPSASAVPDPVARSGAYDQSISPSQPAVAPGPAVRVSAAPPVSDHAAPVDAPVTSDIPPPAPLKGENGSGDVFAKPITAPASPQAVTARPDESPAPPGEAAGGLHSSAPDPHQVSATVPVAPGWNDQGPPADVYAKPLTPSGSPDSSAFDSGREGLPSGNPAPDDLEDPLESDNRMPEAPPGGPPAQEIKSPGSANAPPNLPPNQIPTIGGRKPINSKYAGRVHPSGVRFKPEGFPDFGPHSIVEVRLKGLTGDHDHDEPMANRAVGLKATPEGFVWHHVEDGRTMQLVPQGIHEATRHTGGAAVIRNGGFDP